MALVAAENPEIYEIIRDKKNKLVYALVLISFN
jgi:hypothetical protein